MNMFAIQLLFDVSCQHGLVEETINIFPRVFDEKDHMVFIPQKKILLARGVNSVFSGQYILNDPQFIVALFASMVLLFSWNYCAFLHKEKINIYILWMISISLLNPTVGFKANIAFLSHLRKDCKYSVQTDINHLPLQKKGQKYLGTPVQWKLCISS